MIDIRRGGDIGWHEIEHIPKRPQQDPPRERALAGPPPATLMGGIVFARVLVRHEVERRNQAGLPDVRDMWVIAQGSKAPREVFREHPVACKDIIFLEDRERRHGRGTGQRISGVAVRVEERAFWTPSVKCLVHRVCRQTCGERKIAPGQAFSDT